MINDAEDDYDYWQFAASTLGSGKYIWITEEPGFFLNHLNLNEDPSKYVTLYFNDFKIKHYKYTVYSACIFSLLIRIRLIRKRILNKKTKRGLLEIKCLANIRERLVLGPRLVMTKLWYIFPIIYYTKINFQAMSENG